MKSVQPDGKQVPPRVIKLRKDVYDQLHDIVEDVIRQGWIRYGAKRSDRATMSSVIQEALSQMQKRAERR